ncbi:hypothetical protein EDB87DRAFT_1578472 [Lactarius vividus]|nr:hypothetical protein EDB87DRAFT_1578472 [Lactarius vividus]
MLQPPARRSARRAPFCAAERVCIATVALPMCYVTGLGKDVGPAEASAVGCKLHAMGGGWRVRGKCMPRRCRIATDVDFVCEDSLYRHYSGRAVCMRGGAADLAWQGGREAVETVLTKDDSGVGSASSL